jgi:hypothetical protein
MATKAERFKAETLRAAHGLRPPGHNHDTAGKRAIARGRRKDRLPNPTSHNEAPRSAKNSAYEIEYSQTSRPPRKSGRISASHLKTDSGLRIRVMNENASPRSRAGRGAGNPT